MGNALQNKNHEFSRRGLMALVGTLPLAALASCDSEGGRRQHKSSTDDIREQAKKLAPADYVKTYKVDVSGAAGAFTTIKAATTAVLADKASRLGTPAVNIMSNIWDWRCIEVAPGQYHERIDLPMHTAVIGKGAKPEDVHVVWDGDNTFESSGRSCYLANLHLEHSSTSAQAHPHRDNGPSGDAGLLAWQRRTVTFEKVRFTVPKVAGFGKATNDLAPRAGVAMTFKDCVFDGPGQPQSINLVTNARASQNVEKGTTPATIAFIGCTTISNTEHYPDPDSHKVVYAPAAPIGATDAGYGRGDNFVFLDGKWNVGLKGGVQGLLVLPFAPSQDFSHTVKWKPVASTHFFVDNAGDVSGAKTVLSQNGALSPTAAIPASVRLPVDGIAQIERDYFGAKPPVSETAMASGLADASEVSVSAGQTFAVWVPLRQHALALSGISLAGSQPSGASVQLLMDKDGKPDPAAVVSLGTIPAQKTSVAVPATWFYPGQGGGCWVVVTFAAAGKVKSVTSDGQHVYNVVGAVAGQPLTSAQMSLAAAGSPAPDIQLINKLPATMA